MSSSSITSASSLSRPQITPAASSTMTTPAKIAQKALSSSSSLSTAPTLKGKETVKEQIQDLRDHVKLDPFIAKLPKASQERIFKECRVAYHKSVVAYDQIAGSVAFNHPHAKAFASELCKRAAAIVNAYNEVLEEESPSTTKHPHFTKEFMQKIRIAKLFGNDSINPGSVGVNSLAIEAAVKSGNLREQMTLVYSTMFSFLMSTVMSNPEMIDKVNAKLEGFQIDKTLIEQRKALGTGFSTAGSKVRMKQIPVVEKFRAEKGRKSEKPMCSREGPKGLRMSSVEGLSMREKRVGSHYVSSSSSRRLRWIPGKEWYSMTPISTFAKEAASLGGLPLLTGPSGTTDAILHMSSYLGLSDRLEQGALACTGWMVPVGDHSLHEVRSLASHYGAPYSGLPKDFSTFYRKDPKAQKAIDSRLAKAGFKNPSHYFSSEYQRQVGIKLGLIDKASKTYTLKAVKPSTEKIQLKMTPTPKLEFLPIHGLTKTQVTQLKPATLGLSIDPIKWGTTIERVKGFSPILHRVPIAVTS